MGIVRKTKKEPAKPKYKISRDFDILEMAVHQYMTPKEIAPIVGVTESCVRHTLSVLNNIDILGDVYDYIDMGLELAARLDEAGCEADTDRCVTLIMNELWINGFITRDKLANMMEDEIDNFLMSHRIKRASGLAQEAFCAWQADVKEEMASKAKPKAKAKKTAKK